MKLKYFGHSAFLIEDLLIDPFLTGNPKCTTEPKDVECSIICLTHDHSDHLGDAFEIAKNNNATIVAIHELAKAAGSQGLESIGMNIGGWVSAGEWDIKMVEAQHSSGMGHPAGFILNHRKYNRTIYHAGDTGLFGDMKLIGYEGIDITLLPIGDRYTMGIKDALSAVELIRPGLVIPMHYGTFPAISVDPGDFRKDCPVEVEILKPGDEIEF
ncbi:MAG: metal-dependent hydrolase [ANME-2 cluster archaeon]|nr:metal-dependent hydrolase [ANME-2 cluster archaeon]